MADQKHAATGVPILPRFIYGEEAGGTEHIILVDSDGKVIVSGASTIENINNDKWGGTSLTGRDISPDLQVLTDLKKGALNADGLTAETANVLKAIAHLAGYNRSTWDRWRNNTQYQITDVAGQTSDHQTADQTNYNHKGVLLYMDCSYDGSGQDDVRMIIQGKDDASHYFDLATSAWLDDLTPGYLLLYPGIVEVANQKVSGYLPRTWRVSYDHLNGGQTMNYRVSAFMLL